MYNKFIKKRVKKKKRDKKGEAENKVKRKIIDYKDKREVKERNNTIISFLHLISFILKCIAIKIIDV
jgi:hypothetical protein